jgi:uncharacterized protein (DUF433 family)
MNPVRTDPEILSGVPCFAGTRVPVRTLFDHLAASESLDAFLDDFPTVSREQATEVLKLGLASLESGAETVEHAHR